jgi:ferredoxin--NADP+ reductase
MKANELVEVRTIAPAVTLYRVYAPRIARAQRPGQFVIIRLHDRGERIPLTIADADVAQGTITLVVQEVGKTTAEMAALGEGARLADVAGPLGNPTEVERFGTVYAVGGGIGVAPLLPIARALKAAGNRVVAIIAARNRELLILAGEMEAASHALIVATDDGSAGVRGLVTEPLRRLLAERPPPARVVAIGPVPMMKAAAEATRPQRVPTVVSLNPVMVDGTGMCGGCRITAGGKTKFVCVDGPEFDAHAVDFDELSRRQRFYREQERAAYERWKRESALLESSL